MGLSFCSFQKIDKFELTKDLYKYIFYKDWGQIGTWEDNIYKGFKAQDFRTLKTLIQLLDESERCDGDEQVILLSLDEGDANLEVDSEPLRFKAKSKKFPQLQTCPPVWAFLKP